MTGGRRTWSGALLVAVSAASFGTLAVFAVIADDSGAGVLAVLALRFALAAPVLHLLVRARGPALLRGRTLLVLLLLGGVGYVGQSLAYVSALTLVPASLVAVLLHTYPAFVTVLAVVSGREGWSRQRLLALALATAGAGLAVGSTDRSGVGGGQLLAGGGLAIAAAVVYSLYIVLSEGPTARAGALPSGALITTAAAVVLTVAAVLTGSDLPGTTTGWLAVAGMALVSTVLAIVTFFAGLARLGPTSTATVSTLEPVVTVVLAAAVLSETVTAVQVVGGALVLTAVLVLVRHTSADRAVDASSGALGAAAPPPERVAGTREARREHVQRR